VQTSDASPLSTTIAKWPRANDANNADRSRVPELVDQAEMMSRFHHLNELRSSGTITEEDFERQRHDIFVYLGLEDP
jgi:hypothetical protein